MYILDTSKLTKEMIQAIKEEYNRTVGSFSGDFFDRLASVYAVDKFVASMMAAFATFTDQSVGKISNKVTFMRELHAYVNDEALWEEKFDKEFLNIVNCCHRVIEHYVEYSGRLGYPIDKL